MSWRMFFTVFVFLSLWTPAGGYGREMCKVRNMVTNLVSDEMSETYSGQQDNWSSFQPICLIDEVSGGLPEPVSSPTTLLSGGRDDPPFSIDDFIDSLVDDEMSSEPDPIWATPDIEYRPVVDKTDGKTYTGKAYDRRSLVKRPEVKKEFEFQRKKFDKIPFHILSYMEIAALIAQRPSYFLIDFIDPVLASRIESAKYMMKEKLNFDFPDNDKRAPDDYENVYALEEDDEFNSLHEAIVSANPQRFVNLFREDKPYIKRDPNPKLGGKTSAKSKQERFKSYQPKYNREEMNDISDRAKKLYKPVNTDLPEYCDFMYNLYHYRKGRVEEEIFSNNRLGDGNNSGYFEGTFRRLHGMKIQMYKLFDSCQTLCEDTFPDTDCIMYCGPRPDMGTKRKTIRHNYQVKVDFLIVDLLVWFNMAAWAFLETGYGILSLSWAMIWSNIINWIIRRYKSNKQLVLELVETIFDVPRLVQHLKNFCFWMYNNFGDIMVFLWRWVARMSTNLFDLFLDLLVWVRSLSIRAILSLIYYSWVMIRTIIVKTFNGTISGLNWVFESGIPELWILTKVLVVKTYFMALEWTIWILQLSPNVLPWFWFKFVDILFLVKRILGYLLKTLLRWIGEP